MDDQKGSRMKKGTSKKSKNQKNNIYVKSATKTAKKNNKKLAATLIIAAIALLIVWIVLVGIYAVLKSGEYLADWDTMREYDVVEGDYTMTASESGDAICFIPDTIKVGLIFYQDELVENAAYIPLMKKLASNGVLCIVPSMPLNLSNLDKNAAEDYKKDFTEVKSWYLGGHGLGGESAASFLNKKPEGYLGLILLGSYSKNDISDTSLRVLSVYGTLDGVLDMKKYEKYKDNLPEEYFEEFVIEGANHSGFAVYGLHDGDNEAEITGQNQVNVTVEKILDFMFDVE